MKLKQTKVIFEKVMYELLLEHYKKKLCKEYYEIISKSITKSFNSNIKDICILV
jgi:hypothetical protein